MESEPSTRRDKPMATVSTLPLACQICLGKVKQPVVCSNYHVFCGTCINIWLERSHQCPTCRVSIDHTNPVKHIRGGFSQTEDEEERKSTAELRRTRLEVLYREYKDMLEKYETEVKMLKTENLLLKSQLSAQQSNGCSSSNVNTNNGGGGHSHSTGNPTSEQQLLLLTKKLLDAQKLYDTVQKDIHRLKQENCSLKDTNNTLFRENTKLREEISHRSPQKYSRLTVATLESQLEAQKKEVQSLTRALERSDCYIEDLREQLQREQPLSNQRKKNDRATADTAKAQSDYTQILDAGKSSSSNSHSKSCHAPKSHPGSVVNRSSNNNLPVNRQLFTAEACREQELSTGVRQLQSVVWDTSVEQYLSPEPYKDLDPISKSGPVRENVSRQNNLPSTPESDKKAKPKKVQFNLTEKKSNDTSSFNLEMPSPLTSSSFDKPGVSTDKNHEEPHSSEVTSKHSHKSKSSSAFETNGWNLSAASRKEQTESHIGIQSGKKLYHDTGRDYFSSSKHLSQKLNVETVGAKQTGKHNISINLSELECATPQSELDQAASKSVSSNGAHTNGSKSGGHDKNTLDLEEPSLDDTQAIQSELNDLDISVTPELSDCLKLLNRAEKKVNNAETPYFSTQTGTLFVGKADTGAFVVGNRNSKPSSSGSACHLAGINSIDEGVRNVHGIVGGGSYVPGTTGTLSSWEHGFFSSLRVNPYKHAAPLSQLSTYNQNPDFTAGSVSHMSCVGILPGDSSGKHQFTSDGDCKRSGIAAGPSAGKGVPSALGSVSASLYPSQSAGISNQEFSHTPAVRPCEEFSLAVPKYSRSLPSIPETRGAPSSADFSSAENRLSLPATSMASSSAELRSAEDRFSLPSTFMPSSSSSRGVAQSASSLLPPPAIGSSYGYSAAGCGGYRLDVNSLAPGKAGGRKSTLSVETGQGQSYMMSKATLSNKNYSYVSNASSQEDNTDSFLPEPKKRLFDFDSEDEVDFGTSSKITKTDQGPNGKRL